MKKRLDTNGKLSFKSTIGEATNNQKRREKWYKTIEVDYSKMKVYRDDSAPVPTWKFKKKD